MKARAAGILFNLWSVIAAKTSDAKEQANWVNEWVWVLAELFKNIIFYCLLGATRELNFYGGSAPGLLTL